MLREPHFYHQAYLRHAQMHMPWCKRWVVNFEDYLCAATVEKDLYMWQLKLYLKLQARLHRWFKWCIHPVEWSRRY